MEILVWLGAALSLIGLVGLLWSMVLVVRARRTKMSDDQLREQVRKVLPLNMGALFLSVLGLMLIVTGIFLA